MSKPEELLDPNYGQREIQMYTDWCNSHLYKSGGKVSNLTEDFRSGRLLIMLVENLTRTKLPNPARGTMKIHRIENVSKALYAIMDLGMIDPRFDILDLILAEDIVDGNLKSTLNLIHLLYLHFKDQQLTGSQEVDDQYTITEQITEITNIQLPAIENASEFYEILSEGSYESYDNRIYVSGPCNVGKSTLASILLGEDIPHVWNSTDTLEIYFGQNGIHLKDRTMVPLPKDKEGHAIYCMILRGNPKVDKDQKVTEKIDQKIPRNQPQLVEAANEPQKEKATVINKMKENPVKLTDSKKPKQSKHSLHSLIHKDILEEVRKGQYKVEIAPSDLIDFGGQKAFDMTHQLFITHRGTCLLMFDGRKELNDPLPEYSHGSESITTASVLLHWVSSMLTYCNNETNVKRKVFFVATHRDSYQNSVESRRSKLINQLKKLFSNFEKKQYICFEPLLFINTLNPEDSEITQLKRVLVDSAFQQSSWGQPMPMAWVPLELQFSNLRQDKITIISRDDLKSLNKENGDLALSESQINVFLKVQHNLGKCLYFDHDGLREFAIIQPAFLVNVLRAFITDEMFWPKDQHRNIFTNLRKNGFIYKKDLFKLWSRMPPEELVLEEQYREYMINMLVHLDILVEPKRFDKTSSKSTEYFFVPCMVTARNKGDFLQKDNTGKGIVLSYSLKQSVVPPTLSFRLIAAAATIWPLKIEDSKTHLYFKSAIFFIDDRNEMQITTKGNKILAVLVNKVSSSFISPDVAASIQECLTLALTKILDFYHRNFGSLDEHFDPSIYFEIEVGPVCESSLCLVSVSEQVKLRNTMKMECQLQRNGFHDAKYPLYWMFNKEEKQCLPSCTGLSDEALQKSPGNLELLHLTTQLDVYKLNELAIFLGIEHHTQTNIDYQYRYNPEDAMFTKLLKWKERRKEKATFHELETALKDVNLNKHYLCRVFRREVKLVDLPISCLKVVPDDDILQQLSRTIGNKVLQFGVALGVDIPIIESVQADNRYDIFEHAYQIMKIWRKDSKTKSNATVYWLSQALQSIEGRGLECVKEFYGNYGESLRKSPKLKEKNAKKENQAKKTNVSPSNCQSKTDSSESKKDRTDVNASDKRDQMKGVNTKTNKTVTTNQTVDQTKKIGANTEMNPKIDQSKPDLTRQDRTHTHQKVIKCRKGHYVSDLIKAFIDPSILLQNFTIAQVHDGERVVVREGAYGDLDCLVEFWNEFYDRYTTGVDQKLPCLRHDFKESQWEACARVYLFGWERFKYVPVLIADQFIIACIGRQTTSIVKCFLTYLGKYESQILSSAIEQFDSVEKSDLMDVLDNYSCKRRPSSDNIYGIVEEIAYKEIIQVPMFVINCWKKVLLNSSIASLDADDFHGLIINLIPDSKRIIERLLVKTKTSKDEKTATFLQKYIREADVPLLKSLLRFWTGCDLLVESNRPLTVEFVTMTDLTRKPTANILQLAKHYNNYPEFRTELNNALKNNF